MVKTDLKKKKKSQTRNHLLRVNGPQLLETILFTLSSSLFCFCTYSVSYVSDTFSMKNISNQKHFYNRSLKEKKIQVFSFHITLNSSCENEIFAARWTRSQASDFDSLYLRTRNWILSVLVLFNSKVCWNLDRWETKLAIYSSSY